jgi:membrane glycosyltransferase
MVEMMTLLRARPAEYPIEMPSQMLGELVPANGPRPKSLVWRKLFLLVASLGLTAWTTYEMFEVLSVSGLTLVEWALLVIFAVNISWVCYAFINASAGFITSLMALKDAPPAQLGVPAARTVITFPIYNETVEQIFGTVLSTARMMDGAPGRFDCFVLSDTTDPEIALAEEAAYERICKLKPEGARIWYRRRTINLHRKSGNIRDFVTRWGGCYDYMIVYDADSYMERDTILQLVSEMEAAPRTGLIQTIPQLVGAESLFARIQQFAAALYGPVLGGGIAWWAQKEGNFWGHNAIIRVRAMAAAAGLPELPGRAPFGGHIMSHDFVEAALLRRAGWNVEIRPAMAGSYEQGPPTIIDLVIRDRRWCQGNMQHMMVLLRTRGLAWTSRFHLITGIFSYLSSPIWLLFITVGMFLSLQNSFMNPSYFGDGASLFPIWPVIDSVRALNLFLVTMGILFAPKIYGLAYGLISPLWRREVGVKRTVLGVLTETFLSILIAPILMMTQTIAVVSVLSGRDSGWAPQQRGDEDGYPLAATFRHSAPAMLMGILLTVSALVISPVYAAWLAPATIGLVLSVALSFWTAKRSMGQRLRRHGALVSPAEVNPPASFAAAQAAHAEFANLNPSSLQSLMLDEASQHRRSLIVDPRWVLARNDVHVPLAVARARAETSSTIKEYISSLTKAEKIALLNSCKDLKLVSARFAPPPLIPSAIASLEEA